MARDPEDHIYFVHCLLPSWTRRYAGPVWGRGMSKQQSLPLGAHGGVRLGAGVGGGDEPLDSRGPYLDRGLVEQVHLSLGLQLSF